MICYEIIGELESVLKEVEVAEPEALNSNFL
jgi:hypothetical protein